MRNKLMFLVVFFIWTVPCFAQQVDTAWVRRYNGPTDSNDCALALAVDGSGNVYVTGVSFDSGTSYDYSTIKYLPNGDTAWVRRYNGPGNSADSAYALAVDGSGNVYVTGESFDNDPDADFTTIKYLPNGDTAWIRKYNAENGNDVARALAVDGSGNVYVTGESFHSGTYLDYTTIKYLPNGDTAWVRRYNGPVNGADWPWALAVDGSGNVYVTGQSMGSGTDADIATLKYLPNGDTAWVRRYNTPGRAEGDYAYALAVDESGNVYVTGCSAHSGASWLDYTTIKYLPNGDTAWVRGYNGLGNSDDIARAIAIDGSGNVLVTGLSFGSGTGEDYCTIKYKPNGDTAWVRRYNGPGNAGDDAHAIAVDGSGNVYVTGESYGSGANYDYLTIKYDTEGHTVWEKRYNGPANGHDHAYAMALDGSRNVYVTGGSFGIGTDYDYATIKYTQLQQRDDTLWYFAYSPVDLIITAPNGDSIGVDFNTIPNATYDTTTDKNLDGELDDIVTIPNPLIGDYMVRVVAEPGVDTGHYTEGIRIDGSNETIVVLNAEVPPPGQVDTVIYEVMQYLRGDANGDGKKTVADVVYTINYLFKGGPAPVPLSLGDVNYCLEGKEQVTVADVVYLVNYLFKGGKPPCS